MGSKINCRITIFGATGSGRIVDSTAARDGYVLSTIEGVSGGKNRNRVSPLSVIGYEGGLQCGTCRRRRSIVSVRRREVRNVLGFVNVIQRRIHETVVFGAYNSTDIDRLGRLGNADDSGPAAECALTGSSTGKAAHEKSGGPNAD